ncbi:amino acid deaminase [Aureimonas ureilytica]|uniref:Amino acid deaminase n=1 Tax=Aureimonas ureilytica TaxID=401562 RepID=A0A175RHW0_9HYPH|nr:alanine racemase [Aureimonas ureilytica]KTR02322.1 amino acid deaminase [Aureimonas ureilytica]
MSQLLPFDTDLTVDDRMRGFPPGHAPLPLSAIGAQGWHPQDGAMALPLISLDRAAFAGNAALMMRAVSEAGAAIAPHAKTPMSPDLARRLVEAGAWGTTVADIRQASVMLKAGLKRLILANEIGGAAAARRLAALLAGHPDAEIHVFVDSADLVAHYAAAWGERDDLPVLGLLVELGLGRAGLRTVEAAEAVLRAALEAESPRLRVTGTGAYEGAAATTDPAETRARIEALMAVTSAFHRSLRRAVGPARSLILTAGGSVFFDLVIAGLRDVLADDPATQLILRSGAIFFHDHGIYERGMAALDERRGLVVGGEPVSASEGFKPALRVWAEVLSVPEPGLAICGMGLRDVAIDQGLPIPLQAFRDGSPSEGADGASVLRLNDQHAFVSLSAGSDLRAGDVIAFGLSHPCTCLDRHALLYELGEDGGVAGALALRFG